MRFKRFKKSLSYEKDNLVKIIYEAIQNSHKIGKTIVLISS